MSIADYAVIVAMSQIPQSAFLTPLVPSATPKNFDQIFKDNREIVQYSKNTIDNKGYTTGTPLATRRTLIGHATDFSMNEELSFQLALRRIYAALGQSTNSVPSVGVNQHVMSAQGAANCGAFSSLPAYTVAAKACEIASLANVRWDKVYPGFCLKSLTITVEGNNLTTIQTTWTGSGKVLTRSGTFTPPVFPTNIKDETALAYNYIRNSQAALSIYPDVTLGGTVYTPQCEFRRFTITIENTFNEETGYLCGDYQETGNPDSGAVRGSLPLIEQNITGEFAVGLPLQTDFDFFDKVIKDSPMSLSFKFTGGNIPTTTTPFSLQFDLNKILLDNASPTPQNGELVLAAPFQIFAQGSTVPLTITAQDNIVDPTVAA